MFRLDKVRLCDTKRPWKRRWVPSRRLRYTADYEFVLCGWMFQDGSSGTHQRFKDGAERVLDAL